jgi:uncharacterized protein (DUF2237 family)
MGKCRISIEVTGPHDNGVETDIDQMAHEFVDQLTAQGHAVTQAAIFMDGGASLVLGTKWREAPPEAETEQSELELANTASVDEPKPPESAT